MRVLDLFTLRDTSTGKTDGAFVDKHSAKKERDKRNGATPEQLQEQGKGLQWVVVPSAQHRRGK